MDKFEKVIREMLDLHKAKNSDYGSSADKTYEEFGLTSYLIRLSDKLNRAKMLVHKDAKVTDEKIRDTLIDLAVYSAMAVASLDCEETVTESSESNIAFADYMKILKLSGYGLPSWKLEEMRDRFRSYSDHTATIRKLDHKTYLFEVFGRSDGPCGIAKNSILENIVMPWHSVDEFLGHVPLSKINILDPRNRLGFIRSLELCGKYPLFECNASWHFDSVEYNYVFKDVDLDRSYVVTLYI